MKDVANTYQYKLKWRLCNNEEKISVESYDLHIESEVQNMIVRAIWEFDVDDSEMDEKWVDIKGLCEDFEAVVTCKNTSKKKAVQNMVATINVPSSDFELKNDSNTIFVGKLGAEKTTDLTLKFHVSKSTADGNYPIEIAMSYDDPKANTYTSSGNIAVTVEQPLACACPIVRNLDNYFKACGSFGQSH